MITDLSQTVTTTETATADGALALQDRRRDVVLTIPCGHRVDLELLGRSLELEIRPTIDGGGVDWKNPDRETLQVRFYSASADVIASAVVQYVARKHCTIDSQFAGEAEKVEAAELLRRIAGAMGLTYAAPALVPAN